MKVFQVCGEFDEVYAATQDVFTSLPTDTSMIISALNGDFTPILNWEAKNAEFYAGSSTPEWDDYADVFVGNQKVRFITPTSGRIVTIRKKEDGLWMEVEFPGGSDYAAGQLIKGIKWRNSNAKAEYYLQVGDAAVLRTLQVSEVELTSDDLLFYHRGDSAEANVKYNLEVSEGFSLAVSDWHLSF